VSTTEQGDALHATERMRNMLAFLLVGAFIAVIPAAMVFVIPEKNKDLVTYMVGQLSGMALMALGFYFVNKVGQDALDTKRAETTGKMADAVVAAATPAPDTAVRAADAVASAAANEAERIQGER
jgi:hypothetical protein